MWVVSTDCYFVIPTLATLLVMFLVPDDDDQLFGTELNQLLETVCEDGSFCDLNHPLWFVIYYVPAGYPSLQRV